MLRALAAAVVAGLLAALAAGGAEGQTPPRGGTVVVFVGPRVPQGCLNPFASCDVALPNPWLSQILSGAFEIQPDLTYRPDLVSGVVPVSTKPFALVYRIRPDARWSDRVPVSASDFVFTYDTFRRYSVTAAGEDTREPWRTVRRVVPLDAKTVRVVFRSRTAGWRDLFAVVLPRHALLGEDVTQMWRRSIDNPKTGAPIGSGPFLLRSFEPARELVLVRNPRYWGRHLAHIARLAFRVFASPGAVLEAFRKGEADVGWGFDLPGQALEPFRDAGGTTVASPASQWEHLAIRIGPGGRAALRRPRIRRALAYALDRARLVRGTWEELAPALRPLQSAVLLAQSRYHEPNWSGYRHRLALARQLFAQAGCRRGADGIYVCAGERLSLRLVTNAGNTYRQRVLELVQRQLRTAGVEAVPSYIAPSAFTSQVLPRGEFDIALFGWQVGPAGRSDMFRCGDDENVYGYCNPRTDRDLVRADLMVDESERARALNAADRRLANDVPLIPLYQLPLFVSYRPTIHNIVPHPVFGAQTWNAEDWWRER